MPKEGKGSTTTEITQYDDPTQKGDKKRHKEL